MNDKLKFYAGTIAFMLSVITIIGCIACFFSTPAYATPVKTANDSDIEYVTPLEVHLRELNAQPPSRRYCLYLNRKRLRRSLNLSPL